MHDPLEEPPSLRELAEAKRLNVRSRYARYITQPPPEIAMADLLARGMTLREAAAIYRHHRETGKPVSFLSAIDMKDTSKDVPQDD